MSEATVSVPLALVQITRGVEAMVVEVFAHEVDILFAIHGNDQMQVLDEHVADKEIDADADAEFARLKSAFDRKNAQFVEGVYRNASEVASKLGIGLGPRGRNTDPVLSKVELGHKAGRKPDKAKKAG